MSETATTARAILSRLRKVTRSGSGWVACCPAHEDAEPSLSVSEGDDGRVLFNCHRGCSFEEITAALDVAPSDLMGGSASHRDAARGVRPSSERYDYEDRDGTVVLRVERYYRRGTSGGWRKAFAQKRPDGRGGFENGGTDRPVPYQLPAVLAAVEAGETVFVVEGEKDAVRLRDWGLVATCNAGGAGKWLPTFARYFRGASVVVIPDNDDPGRRHAADVSASLAPVAASVATLHLDGLPEKGDLSDWARLGHDRAELLALVEQARGEAVDATRFDTELVRYPLVDLPSVPQSVVSALPLMLRRLAGHYPAGAERTVALMSGIAVLSGALPNVRVAHYDRHDGYGLHIMFCLVARSGGGKGVMDQVSRLVGTVDLAIREQADEDRAIWERIKASRRRGDPMESPKPFPKSYLLPANASKTYLLRAVEAAGETACIVETEIDTLVGASEQEWGDFSDLIRKAFHHEPYRVGRMGTGDGDTLTIDRPSLALALSGTWGQFERLFGANVDNGFFNRFGFFVSNARRGFRSQRPTQRTYHRDAWFRSASGAVAGLHGELAARHEPLVVHLDEPEWDAVDAVFRPAYEHAQESLMSERLLPFVQRVNVMAVRLAALITLLRAWDHDLPIGSEPRMWATPLDVQLALEIARVWYAHGYALLSHLTPYGGADPLAAVPEACRALFEALPETFRRADANEAGATVGSKPRTVKDHLQRLQEAGMLHRDGHTYRKVSAPEAPAAEASGSVAAELGAAEALDTTEGSR